MQVRVVQNKEPPHLYLVMKNFGGMVVHEGGRVSCAQHYVHACICVCRHPVSCNCVHSLLSTFCAHIRGARYRLYGPSSASLILFLNPPFRFALR